MITFRMNGETAEGIDFTGKVIHKGSTIEQVKKMEVDRIIDQQHEHQNAIRRNNVSLLNMFPNVITVSVENEDPVRPDNQKNRR